MSTKFSAPLLGASFIALGAAASAQDLCGGAGVNGQWIGGNEVSSDVTLASSYMEQMALVLMQNSYTALFNVSAPTEVRMEAQGRGAGDPLIELRDSTGNIVLSDDDSGGGGAARAESILQAGTYCLSMTSYDGSPMTGFVRIGRTEHEALTPGMGSQTTLTPPVANPPQTNVTSGGQPPGEVCDMARVSNFLGNGPIDGALAGGVSATASVDEVAYWGFSLNSPAPITITAENEYADPVVVLYDGNGNWLAENDDYDGLNSRIDMTSSLAPGNYCVAVTAYSNSSEQITLTVSGYDANAALVATYDNAEAAPPLDGSYPVTALGPLTSRLRADVQNGYKADWYSFEVTQASLVVIEAITNNLGDPNLTLFDDFGREVGWNDDYGASYDSFLAVRVNPGNYLLAVRQFNDTGPVLTRLLIERYIAAQ